MNGNLRAEKMLCRNQAWPGDVTVPTDKIQRRGAPRRRMLKHVQILSLDKTATSAVDLTLRNTSATGAQLFGPAESLRRVPDKFYLVAPGQLRMIRCRVVWKGDDLVGVSFRSDPGPLVCWDTDTEEEPDRGGEDTPPESYYLDRTTGAVLMRTPDREVRGLEQAVSAALGLKVEIAEAGAESRVVLHVPVDRLNDVCRRLSRQV
jgi:hypothetical protein